MEPWYILAGWWAGMFPASWLCGVTERRAGKSYPPAVKAATVLAWPVVAVILMPLVWAFQAGRSPAKPRERDGGDN